MNEVHVVAVLYAKEGHEDALRADLTTVAQKSAQEDGNMRYELFADANDSRRFVLVEHWRDAEAQQRHHNHSAHIAHFHAHGEKNVEHREAVHLLRHIV